MPSNENFRCRLIMADGTILDNCECGYYDGSLWCYLKDFAIIETFPYFSDSDKFSAIIFDIIYAIGFTDRTIYSGFDKITSILQKKGQVDICITGDSITIEQKRIDNLAEDTDK